MGKWNVYCIIGFFVSLIGAVGSIFSLFCLLVCLLGTVVCLIGLKDARNHGDRGFALGVCGIATSIIAVWITFGVLAYQKHLLNQQAEYMENLQTQRTESMKPFMQSVNENVYLQYDGQLVKGDQVLSIIRQFQDDTISIDVLTARRNETRYIYDNATFSVFDAACTINGDKMTAQELSVAIRSAQDPASATYIEPTKNFLCTVCRDPRTNVITGMHFAQK